MLRREVDEVPKVKEALNDDVKEILQDMLLDLGEVCLRFRSEACLFQNLCFERDMPFTVEEVYRGVGLNLESAAKDAERILSDLNEMFL